MPLAPLPTDPPSPHITMKVRVPACGQVGRELEYRVFLENCSAGDAHHVIVKCPLPATVRFVRASPAPHKTEPELQWHLGTMHGGGKCEVSVIVAPREIEDLRMCFRVQYEHGQCVTTRITPFAPDQGPGIGPDGRPIPPMPPVPPEFPDGKRPPRIEPVPPIMDKDKEANLKLTMEGPKERPSNLAAKYFLTVTNDGAKPATNLLLRASLPEKTEFVAASDDGVHMGGQIAWLLKELPPNQKWTVELTFKSQGQGLRCVKAAALADRNVSAQSELCTNFVGASALFLEMIDRDDPIPIGGDTSYPVLVVNTGGLSVSNLRIRALIPVQMVLAKTSPAEHQLAERVPQGQWIVMNAPGPLEGGKRAEFEIFVKGVTAGDARFVIEMTADQLEKGKVVEMESTHIYNDEGRVPGQVTSRKKRR